jgi:MFS transporter, PHS family, inorganic phosphate transporter
LFDVAFYAMALFGGKVIEISGSATTLEATAGLQTIVALIALPGYFLATVTLRCLSQERLQVVGFLVVGGAFAVLASVWSKAPSELFVALFGITFLLANWGPNMTTYVVPTSRFPHEVRATCHGISAAAGKAGAAMGAAAMRPLMTAFAPDERLGLTVSLALCSIVMFSAAWWTHRFLKPSRTSLSALG